MVRIGERMTEKRFINDIDNGKLIDTKGELSTIHYSDKVDFYELWEFLNKLNDENEQLKKELKRCRDWLNSDKNDYQLTLAFIKSKGYSLKDVLEYEKELEE